MVLLVRAPQSLTLPNGERTEILAPTNLGQAVNGNFLGDSAPGPTQPIVAATATSPATIAPTATPSSMTAAAHSSTPSTIATSSPTANAAAHANNMAKAGKIAAIVVPIVFAILLIPLAILLYRSHQMKKAEQRRNSLRYSGDSIIKPPHVPSKNSSEHYAGMSAAIPASKSRPPMNQMSSPRTAPVPPRRPRKAAATRPSNSLGLFNFDLSPASTPGIRSPDATMSPARLSVARAIGLRRSEVSIIEGRQSSPKSAQSSVLLADPPPPYGIAEPQTDAHFAPLHQIGTAQSRSTSRPPLHRNPSSGGVSAVSRPSTDDGPNRSHARGPSTGRPRSPGFLPPIPRGSMGFRDRFSMSDYAQNSHRDTVSTYHHNNRDTRNLDRRSEVSALSSDDDEYSYSRSQLPQAR